MEKEAPIELCSSLWLIDPQRTALTISHLAISPRLAERKKVHGTVHANGANGDPLIVGEYNSKPIVRCRQCACGEEPPFLRNHDKQTRTGRFT